ncbi:MAG: hypothetical protein OXF33_07225 [Rhodospirillales bacterium]|nr:hypothetical protein [Rhodospirillales bacterium]
MNDLAWTTFGFSRDDARRSLAGHLEAGVFAVDPFGSLDVAGGGGLIQFAATRRGAARSA